jgi:hypothetical protein
MRKVKLSDEMGPKDAPPPGVWAGDPRSVWSGEINQNDVPPTERPCIAHGCPLLGSMSASLSASRSAVWTCRFHFGKRPAEYGAITRALKVRAESEADREARLEREAMQAEA